MLASDINNTEFVGAANPDAALNVRFYENAVKNEFKTSLEGRPIFDTVIYVEISTPGNQLNIINTPIRDEHKRRFPLHWAHFQNSKSEDSLESGTPISNWQILDVSQVEELRALKFKTIDSIANASDQHISSIGMICGMSPFSFREKAKTYLMVSKDAAIVQKQADEIRDLRKMQEEKEAKHAAKMEEMEEKLTKLMLYSSKMREEREEKAKTEIKIVRKSPGRPRKEI